MYYKLKKNNKKGYNMAIKNFGIKEVQSFLQDKTYNIPDYQREYSWDSDDQLQDFWDDLESTKLGNRTHFIGQIVVHEDVNDGKNYIIDGQQRTTTIIIFLSVLRDKFQIFADNNEEAQNIREDIRIKFLGRWTQKKNELRLHLGVADREFFKENIQKARPSQEPSTPSQKRIIKAYEFFDKILTSKLEDSLDDNDKVTILTDYYETLINKFNVM